MIYSKTPLGQQAFKDRSAAFTSKLRTIFLLFDGERHADAVLQTTVALGTQPSDVEHLIELGFIEKMSPVNAVLPDEEQQLHPEMSDQQRFVEGMRIATALTSKLGLFGFRLNLAIESCSDIRELRQLLPKIEAACGRDAAYSLRRILLK